MSVIKERRMAANLSQRELAAKIGITQGAVSQWENGETLPGRDKIFELSKILGCSIEDLLEKPSPSPTAENA